MLLVAAAFAVCDRLTYRQPTGDDYARYDGRNFRVVRVVDGDTLDIDVPDAGRPHTRIRLWGVDTPELARGDVPAMHFGEEAWRFAKERLEGREVVIELAPSRTRDKYERLLAYVYFERGGAMFNELLAEEGLAFADQRFRHPYDDRFELLEKRARVAGRGLWAKVTSDQMPEWRKRMDEQRRSPGGIR